MKLESDAISLLSISEVILYLGRKIRADAKYENKNITILTIVKCDMV